MSATIVEKDLQQQQTGDFLRIPITPPDESGFLTQEVAARMMAEGCVILHPIPPIAPYERMVCLELFPRPETLEALEEALGMHSSSTTLFFNQDPQSPSSVVTALELAEIPTQSILGRTAKDRLFRIDPSYLHRIIGAIGKKEALKALIFQSARGDTNLLEFHLSFRLPTPTV